MSMSVTAWMRKDGKEDGVWDEVTVRRCATRAPRSWAMRIRRWEEDECVVLVEERCMDRCLERAERIVRPMLSLSIAWLSLASGELA